MPPGRYQILVRLLLVIPILVALVGCSGPGPGPEPLPTGAEPTSGPPEETEITVLHYNVLQGEKDGVHEYVVERVSRLKPTILSLNEVCEGDYGYWVDKLSQYGYVGNFAPSEVTGHCAQFGAWTQGTAVFVANGRTSSVKDVDAGQSTACITATNPRVLACSTHVTAPDGKDQGATVTEIRALPHKIREKYKSGLPLVVAGDFNVDPWHPVLNDPFYQKYCSEDPYCGPDYESTPFYKDFYELDENGPVCMRKDPKPRPQPGKTHGGHCTYVHHTQGPKKLDYIFVDREHFQSDVSARVMAAKACGENDDIPCSDHDMLLGTAQLKVASTASSSLGGEGSEFPQNRFSLAISPAYQKTEPWCDADSDVCERPVWEGVVETTAKGKVNGSAELWISILEICKNIGGGFVIHAKQEIQVKGMIHGKDGNLTLNFRKLKINYERASCNHPEPRASRYQSYLDETLTMSEPVRGEVPGIGKDWGYDKSFESSQRIEINGRPYELRLSN